MTKEEFYSKWIGRTCYPGGGTIERTTYFSLYCKDYLCVIDADVLLTPSFIGFRDEKQRREFYKDAKGIGYRRFPGKKNMWYKRIYQPLSK